MKEEIFLIGPGGMGKEYYKVLKGMEKSVKVFGRGKERAKEFEGIFETKVITGDLAENLSKENNIPEFAINATSIESLIDTTRTLMEIGIKNILVEKPLGIDEESIKLICELAEQKGCNVFVAYNRRFFSSTQKAMEIIEQDGGVSSFSFEFTEWGDRIAESVGRRIEEYKEAWFLLNSSHVVDLAFFLGGTPVEISSYTQGELDWHKTGCVYAGAGKTNKNTLFSYQANWDAPGRWGIEILTKQHRLYLRPMEELYIQKKNTVAINQVEIDDGWDKKYKPGLYKQVEAFLENQEDVRLLSVREHLSNMKYYRKMENK